MYMTVLKADARSLMRAKNPLEVRDAYAVHQWLTNQQDMSRVDSGLLYHVEIEQTGIMLYIQSAQMFNLREVESVGFMVIQANVPMQHNQQNGDKIYFQVRVLPQKYQDKKRVPIFNPSERDAWFVQKCADAGIRVLACQVHNTEPVVFTKNNKTVREHACVYAGVATVENAETMKEMLQRGFGRGKAFGAGLFMLA